MRETSYFKLQTDDENSPNKKSLGQLLKTKKSDNTTHASTNENVQYSMEGVIENP